MGTDIAGILPQLLPLGNQIRFVVDNHIGNLPLLEALHQILIHGAQSHRAIHHKNGNICMSQFLLCLFYPQRTQLALIVQTGGVDDHHRAKRQQFHCLFHRVGGGALYVGNHCQLLAGYRVYQTGFAGIAHSEKADVKALGGNNIM